MFGTNVTRTEQAGVHDMCCVQSTPSKPLLIVAYGYQGAFAYDTTTSTVEWNVKGKLPGMTKILSVKQITTDASGHLFMCDDYNDCIQMFNLEGQYMGAATREGDPYIGKPWIIQWCKSTSSLVVAHVNFTKHNISKIQIQGELADDMLNESNEAAVEPVEPQPVVSATDEHVGETVTTLPEEEPHVGLTAQDSDSAAKYKGNYSVKATAVCTQSSKDILILIIRDNSQNPW